MSKRVAHHFGQDEDGVIDDLLRHSPLFEIIGEAPPGRPHAAGGVREKEGGGRRCPSCGRRHYVRLPTSHRAAPRVPSPLGEMPGEIGRETTPVSGYGSRF